MRGAGWGLLGIPGVLDLWGAAEAHAGRMQAQLETVEEVEAEPPSPQGLEDGRCPECAKVLPGGTPGVHRHWRLCHSHLGDCPVPPIPTALDAAEAAYASSRWQLGPASAVAWPYPCPECAEQQPPGALVRKYANTCTFGKHWLRAHTPLPYPFERAEVTRRRERARGARIRQLQQARMREVDGSRIQEVPSREC